MKSWLIQVPNRSFLQKEINYYMKKNEFTSYDEPQIYSVEAYSITYRIVFYTNTNKGK